MKKLPKNSPRVRAAEARLQANKKARQKYEEAQELGTEMQGIVPAHDVRKIIPKVAERDVPFQNEAQPGFQPAPKKKAPK